MDFLIAMYIATAALSFVLLVNEKECPYDTNHVDKLTRIMTWSLFGYLIFIPTPRFMVDIANNIHHAIGDFKFFMMWVLLFWLIVRMNNAILDRWSVRSGKGELDDTLPGWVIFVQAGTLSIMAVGVIALVSYILGSPNFTFGLILGVL